MKLILCLLVICSTWAWAVPSEGHKIMVAGPTPYAIEVARKISSMGGNVVDVAVGVGFTLSVTSPYYAALGGGGFALVKMDGPVEALDFREVAPKAYGEESFQTLDKKASLTGGHAVGVPGVPAGLFAIHKKYGKLKWSQVLTAPIQIAQNGFLISGEWVRRAEGEKARFNASGLKYFFKKNISYRPGEVHKQPQLALALKELQNKKLKGFYEGHVASDMIRSIAAAGGRMTLEDLKNYKVRWLKPMETEFAGHRVFLMPPPSSGGVVIQAALRLMELTDLKSLPAFSVDELHLLGQISSRAYRSRSLLGDPDFYENPLKSVLSEEYLGQMASSIKKNKATIIEPLPEWFGKESSETTHFSVMDSEGHAVAMTVTLNGSYGSGVVSEKFGIALNNEMDDFTTRPSDPNMYGLIQGPGNNVVAGKRPLSSMSPTLVEKDGKIVMSLGAPGGPRIISAVLQVLYRVLSRGMELDLAVQAPRVHHQFQPNTLFVDKDRLPPETLKALKDRSNLIEESSLAKIYAVRLNDREILEGAFDSRGEGAAGGL